MATASTSTMLAICGSFMGGKCKKRLEFYAEVESDSERMVLERKPCPFYLDSGACKLDKGIISYHTTGYPQKHTYLRTEGAGGDGRGDGAGSSLVEIEKPFCDVLRAEKKR